MNTKAGNEASTHAFAGAEASLCERKGDLLEYLYDEMPTAQRTEFGAHLLACKHCATELAAFQRLRTDLRAWDAIAVPSMELVIPRSRWEVLRELLETFPLWGRGLLAAGAVAALLLMTFGVQGLFTFGRGSDATASLATQVEPIQPVRSTALSQPSTALTPELKQLINAEVNARVTAEVAKTIEQERQALRAQLAAYQSKNADQYTRMQAVARQLRQLETRHAALLASNEPSLRQMMMADYGDSANER